jgi:hypothetical protein
MLSDDITGALSLSIIDFILSFVFIAGIGGILYLFPYINKLGEVKENKY